MGYAAEITKTQYFEIRLHGYIHCTCTCTVYTISNDLIEEVLQVQIWVEDVDAVGADVKGVHD